MMTRILRFPLFILGMVVVTAFILAAHVGEIWIDLREAARDGWRHL